MDLDHELEDGPPRHLRVEPDGERLRRMGVDAQAWSDAFWEQFHLPVPFDATLTWFANAIEAGRAAGRREAVDSIVWQKNTASGAPSWGSGARAETVNEAAFSEDRIELEVEEAVVPVLWRWSCPLCHGNADAGTHFAGVTSLEAHLERSHGLTKVAGSVEDLIASLDEEALAEDQEVIDADAVNGCSPDEPDPADAVGMYADRIRSLKAKRQHIDAELDRCYDLLNAAVEDL